VVEEYELPKHCSDCGAVVYAGFARCNSCGALRPEFVPHASVVASTLDACIFSGAETDVVLPNGDGIWAPYFLSMLEDNWLDSEYAFTDVAFDKVPTLRGRKTLDENN